MQIETLVKPFKYVILTLSVLFGALAAFLSQAPAIDNAAYRSVFVYGVVPLFIAQIFLAATIFRNLPKAEKYFIAFMVVLSAVGVGENFFRVFVEAG